MITRRPSSERGHANHGWLHTYHTFSFADYRDPVHMGFRSLRVINEDVVAPGQGFGTHPHHDMEIVTYVLSGGLEHRDSTGSHGVITPGLVQRMSAGTGVTHSEFNASKTDPVHLLQIWIVPEVRGVTPRYEDRPFPVERMMNRLGLLVSPDGADGSLDIYQDVKIFSAVLDAGRGVTHELAAARHVWVQVARGRVTVNGLALDQGDGAALSDEPRVTIAAAEPSEILLFDLK
ncbi:MAG: pirin family protein [Acidobacteria bacterium]|nr:pirin family protein [Acidobacteriota bacterium]